MVFFKNEAISLDYCKPYLIMKIKKTSFTDLEIKQFSLVIKKFYKTKDNKGIPIKFGMIIYFEKFGVFKFRVMQQIGKIFSSLKEQAQKQLYGSSIILHTELRHILKKILNMFKNDRPISFATDIKEAKIQINKYISENSFVVK